MSKDSFSSSSSAKAPGMVSDAASGVRQVRRFFFRGKGGSLFGIQIVNIFLTLVTFGIYSFWGRVRVRQFLFSAAEFEGDRFSYHGTGKELLIGWLKAFVLFGLPLILLLVIAEVADLNETIGMGIELAVYLAIGFVFVPLAIVGTYRYRLSRTSWRGIRFSFRGRPTEFLKLFVQGSLLTLLTMGLYYPFFEIKQYGFMASQSYFGNRKFRFDGDGWALFPSYLAALFLSLLTLGLYWFWYSAKKQRYLLSSTSFDLSTFRSTVTGGELLWLWLGNLLLLVVTLGLGWPWVTVRNVRFYLTHLTLEGSLDWAAIEQEAQPASATGEGLASFFDVDFDLG